MTLQQESIFIPIDSRSKLHLKHFYSEQPGSPVLMLHGSVENGKIFYSESQKGLGPYLATQGFDVYIADLRGRGLSAPPIDRQANYGQTEAITEDIPAFLEKIVELRGNEPQHWVAHSWGGVLLASYLARHPEQASKIKTMVCIATKRCIRAHNWEIFWKIDLFWHLFGPRLTRIFGYLPAKYLGIGSDNESRLSHQHCSLWVKPSPWIDPVDQFDYSTAIKKLTLPPTLYLTGSHDHCLGHPHDVRDFMKECGLDPQKLQILAPYNHIDILTHPKAKSEHFPKIVQWLQQK